MRRTTTARWPRTRGTGAWRSARSTLTCSRTTPTCWGRSATRTPGCGRRRWIICASALKSWTQTGSRDLKLWFADGTNYPGQDSIAARQERLAGVLAAVYARLGTAQRLILEYKLFEPAFYHTDVPDWGTAYLHCAGLGERALVMRGYRASRGGHEHRVHRFRAAAGREAGARSTSTRGSTRMTT